MVDKLNEDKYKNNIADNKWIVILYKGFISLISSSKDIIKINDAAEIIEDIKYILNDIQGKNIDIKIKIPPLLGKAFLCNDLLLGMSTINENKLYFSVQKINR